MQKVLPNSTWTEKRSEKNVESQNFAGSLKIRIEFQLVEEEHEVSNKVELISCAEGRYHVF